jgi:hydroxymethylpyrimidine pyrophosphatase-like HAD family hydrolase
MSKRLAFIDLDGTLLGPDKTVSAANRAALDRLRAANVQIVIASRPAPSQYRRTRRHRRTGLDPLVARRRCAQ